MAKVLIVEDEIKIAQLLADYLEASQHQVTMAHDGLEAEQVFEAFKPDIALLDLMLPGKDGVSLCTSWRQQSQTTGIIMITAKVEEVDRLLGLQVGADDYICKPFSPKEVVARVEALLRRLKPPTNNTSSSLIEINEESFQVLIKGQELETTPTEFRLLSVLVKKQGQIYSRSQLVDHLHDDFRDVSDRAVDSHIKNLRKKLKDALPDQEIIKSVYGVGYKVDL